MLLAHLTSILVFSLLVAARSLVHVLVMSVSRFLKPFSMQL